MPISIRETSRVGVVVVWDKPGTSNIAAHETILWRNCSCENQTSCVSIPKLIEANIENYKKIYLSWVFELGNLLHRGKRIIDLLEINKGLSYWWLSRISEKCNLYKSTQIETAIKLIAFGEYLNDKNPKKLILITSNNSLVKCFEVWCKDRGVDFATEANKQARELNKIRTGRILMALPKIMVSVLWLVRYITTRYPLRKVGLQCWKQSTNKLTFITYSANTDPDAINTGTFKSKYWPSLPESLEECKINSNWLHIFVEDAVLENAKAAANLMRRLNKNESGGDTHVALESFISVKVIFKSLLNWITLVFKARGIRKTLSNHNCNSIYIWPLIKEDWALSIYGKDAIKNILFYNLFDRAMSMLSRQHIGVYLQENQGWEMAFLHAWKKWDKGTICGFPHSTVRDWDLRYFFDPRIYSSTSRLALPTPDFVAASGPAILASLVNGGFPRNKIVEVEALRFLHLVPENVAPNTEQPHRNFHLLVLGGYSPSNTHRQFSILHGLSHQLTLELDVTVKLHPLCDVNVTQYLDVNTSITNDSIDKLLLNCDAVYTDCETSAAVDAYFAGLPVISELNPESLNISPLRDRKGVLFVSSPDELAKAIVSIKESKSNTNNVQDFFYIDSDLPRWKELLLDNASP